MLNYIICDIVGIGWYNALLFNTVVILCNLWIKTDVLKFQKIGNLTQGNNNSTNDKIFTIYTIVNLTAKARNKIATNFALLTCQKEPDCDSG
jgi:hypothetical protein